MIPTAQLLERFRQRDRHALARLLTLASQGGQAALVRAALGDAAAPPRARVIGFTGSAGVGKSTLAGKIIERFREAGRSVAVLACDPESPLTGGALLGDRFRMPTRPDDPDLFIRSLAAPAGHDALAEHLDEMIQLLEAFGFDYILLETVGAGQGDTAVHELTDVVVVLLQPETGDEIQWEKAGLLEVADVVVIHKADLPLADQVETQVRNLLNLPGCRNVPILRVSSTKNIGLDDLYGLLEQTKVRRSAEGRDERALLRLAQQLLRQRFAVKKPELAAIRDRWACRHIDDSQAAREILQYLGHDSAGEA
jgi:LAO/AO transport system kinase